jgi:hypothetical protein
MAEPTNGMKADRVCPRCESGKIWFFPVMGERSGEGEIKPISITFEEAQSHNRGMGFFETYICAGCGYTEWYAKGLSGLKPDPNRGVVLLERRR